MFKQFALKFSILFFVILSIFSIGFSTCYNTPEYFEVESGSENLGKFSVGDTLHIKGDLEESPLFVDVVYEDSEPQCFEEDSSQVDMRLSTSASSVESQSFSTQQINDSVYESRFSFEFTGEDLVIDNFFQTQYKYKDESFRNALRVHGDTKDPEIFTSVDEDRVFAKGQDVMFDYSFEDSQSGLDVVEVDSQVINLSGDSSYQDSYSIQLNETKTILLRAKDKVGYQSSKRVTLRVDENSPTITNFNNLGNSYDGVSHSISFSVVVEDESLGSDVRSRVSAEEVDSSHLNNLGRPTSCEQSDENRYLCEWEDVSINADESKDLNLKITAEDDFGNVENSTFTTRAFIDSSGPEITTFEVQNEYGSQKNIISSFAKNSFVKLEVDDESLTAGMDIYPQFDILGDDLTYSVCGPGCYEIDLSNYVDVYKDDVRNSVPFEITVADKYGNSASDTINVTIDNYKPNIKDINIEKQSQVDTGVFKSGDKINLEIDFEEENFEEERIFADLKSITADSDKQKVEPTRCVENSQGNHTCEFENIELGTGYFNRTSHIVVGDDAGNRAVGNFTMEVLKQNEDDIPEVYTIPDMEIINPLNRNQFESVETAGDITAWFEGEIDQIDEGYDIVNYEFESCNTTFVGGQIPLERGNPKLYPNDVMTQLNSDNASQFAIRANLGFEESDESVIENMLELQDMQMDCSMFLLFRDDTQIYEPGVNLSFTMNFSFYDLPRGNLLRSNSKSLKEDIDDVAFVDETFDKIYRVYEVVDTVCSTGNTISQSLSTTSASLDTISNTIRPSFPSVSTGIDTVMKPIQGANSFLSLGEDGFITEMCRYVTCEYGTLDTTKDILDDYNQAIPNLVCNSGSGLVTTPGGED